MLNLSNTLAKYGRIGIESIKRDIAPLSATGKTSASLRFSISRNDDVWHLKLLGRKFFKAIETGRGPRKNTEYQEFDLHLLEYMKARGIGADLSEKRKSQLAKFLAYKINKEGDETYKKGGRQVYSNNLNMVIEELKKALMKDFKEAVLNEIRQAWQQQP